MGQALRVEHAAPGRVRPPGDPDACDARHRRARPGIARPGPARARRGSARPRGRRAAPTSGRRCSGWRCTPRYSCEAASSPASAVISRRASSRSRFGSPFGARPSFSADVLSSSTAARVMISVAGTAASSRTGTSSRVAKPCAGSGMASAGCGLDALPGIPDDAGRRFSTGRGFWIDIGHADTLSLRPAPAYRGGVQAEASPPPTRAVAHAARRVRSEPHGHAAVSTAVLPRGGGPVEARAPYALA